MAGIFAHGSFGHFNMLTASLAIPLLLRGASPPLLAVVDTAPWSTAHRLVCAVALAFLVPAGLLHLPFSSGLSRSFAAFPQIDRWVSAKKRGLLWAVRALQPYRLVHSYGAAQQLTNLRRPRRHYP